MNPEQASLLQAILDVPADDAARLVYADWLEENGDEGDRLRAEFIRVQVELATLIGHEEPWVKPQGVGGQMMPMCRKCDRQHDLEYRAGELLQQGYFAWSPFDHEFHKQNHQAIEYRRGFVRAVRCPLQSWLDHGAAIVRAHPVQVVRIAGWDAVHVDREPGFSPWTMDHPGAPDHPFRLKMWHQTEESAYDDLSQECLAVARAPDPIMAMAERLRR